jgi:hypothetical protein
VGNRCFGGEAGDDAVKRRSNVPIIQLIVILIVIVMEAAAVLTRPIWRVLLWVTNTYLGPYIDVKILKIINVVVVIAVVIWLLSLFIGPIGGIRQHPRREVTGG